MRGDDWWNLMNFHAAIWTIGRLEMGLWVLTGIKLPTWSSGFNRFFSVWLARGES